MKTLNSYRHRQVNTVSTRYVVTDRLHHERCVCVAADQLTATVSNWLAQLGAHSSLVEELARTVRQGDWAAAHAIADALSIDVTVAA
ncbi:hypothetical protein HZU40_22180 [Mycolicibacterium fluoranthenivorans]|jgi:hypothetical protein|uniref:Uncharacterized protein n=1 Tax=Mycolicibacterium fluoranthenivorans TaxID=258505 RepID=A0A7G8P9B6_9MYCO|nr:MULTISPECIES: hypothetical protein [Mycobacteriaceae]MCV7250882.1 hypothetical protein [Mycobacterium hackensackense]QNJ90932.1 hypothetical protein HZU40_22180 [Mycolicibacterium fluoranthenivorans]